MYKHVGPNALRTKEERNGLPGAFSKLLATYNGTGMVFDKTVTALCETFFKRL